MSLLRTALSLALLLLGIQARVQDVNHKATKGHSHRNHHKHHKGVLLSHGRSRFEIVEPSADKEEEPVGKDVEMVGPSTDHKPAETEFSMKLAKSAEKAQHHLAEESAHKSEVKPAKKKLVALKAKEEDPSEETQEQPLEKHSQDPDPARKKSNGKASKAHIKDAQKEEQPLAKHSQDLGKFASDLAKGVDETDIEDTQKEEQPLAQHSQDPAPKESSKKVSKEHGTYEVRIAAAQEDNKKITEHVDQEENKKITEHVDQENKKITKQISMGSANAGLREIRREIRLARKKDHQIKVLKQSLAAQQKLLDESAGLQAQAKEDDESEEMIQSQVHELTNMRNKISKLINSNLEQAETASEEASDEAKALFEAAATSEKAAEAALDQAKKIKEKAAKLQKIAQKQLAIAEDEKKEEHEKQKAPAAPLPPPPALF